MSSREVTAIRDPTESQGSLAEKVVDNGWWLQEGS